jgi:hypothetical protein
MAKPEPGALPGDDAWRKRRERLVQRHLSTTHEAVMREILCRDADLEEEMGSRAVDRMGACKGAAAAEPKA